MIKIKVALFSFSILFLVNSSLSQSSGTDVFYTNVNEFYNEFVKGDLVDYAAIKSNPAKLNSILQVINEYYPEGNEPGQKALLINAYNLFAIKQLADNFPVSSPNDIPGFYDATKFQIGSINVTLNHLENKILRKDFEDRRLHFVLVCGALGCPPIANFAYTPEKLDEQMDAQTKLALNNPKFVYEKDGKVYLSQIFNWYKADFGSNSETLEFINSYRNAPFENTSINYYPYDWTINDSHIIPAETIENIKTLKNPTDGVNLQTFTAGTLLGKGLWDITLFNSLYTQTKSNWLGDDFTGPRETFYTTLLQLTLGTTKNKRVNLGFDVSFRGSAKRTDLSFASAFDAFSFKNNDSTRVGISSVGPRIKWIPFAGNTDFSIQSTFTVPTTANNESVTSTNGNDGLYWLDWSRFTSWTQFFYTKTSGDFQLFLEADIWARIRTSKQQITHIDAPLTVIGSWFVAPKWTVYGIVQHNTRFVYNINPVEAANDFIQPMNYTAPGLGIKFQPVSNMTLELLYTNFVRGVNTGLGESFNFGIKYLPKRARKAKSI